MPQVFVCSGVLVPSGLLGLRSPHGARDRRSQGAGGQEGKGHGDEQGAGGTKIASKMHFCTSEIADTTGDGLKKMRSKRHFWSSEIADTVGDGLKQMCQEGILGALKSQIPLGIVSNICPPKAFPEPEVGR